MTRSVEIPEAAVAKGAERLWLFRTPIAKTRESCTEQAREVIEAALPYLAPAGLCACGKPASHVDADPDDADWACRVPAGDGGLRDRLKELQSYCSRAVDDPKASEDEQLAYDDVHIQLAGILAKYPAPTGDGGLREALEASARDKIAEWYGSEWNASEDKFYETYDGGGGGGGGISCVDDEAMLELRGVRLALDLALAAHPVLASE